MTLLHRIDPRRSLAAAVAWLVIGLSVALVVAANLGLRGFVRQTLLEQHSQRLENAVDHVGAELDTALSLRLQSVSTVAAMLSDKVDRSDPGTLQQALSAVFREVPDLSWMAVTDANGDVIAATDPAVIGSNVYQYAWMSQGLDIAWAEEGVMPGARFVKLTAPVRNADGAIVGVVAARLNWNWVEHLADGISAQPGDWLLVDRDGIVRLGPARLLGQDWQSRLSPVTPFDPTVAGLGPDASDLPPRILVRRLEGRPHLLARGDSARGETLQKLGWQVVVIQPVASVAAIATAIEWRMTVTLMLLGAVAALLGLWMARRLTRRVSVIARSADAVLAGSARQIEVPPGFDEAARLGTALNRLLAALQRERDELRSLNAELDQRVAQRTDEIRRLALEARDAAVVRERLRLARDLHDTLAHSMMAMLTEIRVLKRLASTRPAELPDELVRAEQAAREGLQEARLAIAQMRSSPVRDIGLGPALAESIKGLAERSGLDARLVVDDEAAGRFADEPAETVFRMTEEMLRNVERHAGARQVRVTLRRDADSGDLALDVDDDGVGFDPATIGAGHYGLQGLREQAEVIGAGLSIASAPGAGTRISLRLAARPAVVA